MVFALLGCPLPWSGYKYNTGTLPDTPVNLENFNTDYDDYNSSAPSLGMLVPFCYSTNRHSQGGEFNIIYEPMAIVFSKTTGELTVSNEYAGWHEYGLNFAPLVNLVRKTHSPGNEFGPCLLYPYRYEFADADLVLMYASDEDGDFDIAYTFYRDSDFSVVQPVAKLNSEFNDLYPSFSSDFSQIFFCSDREEGVFNIFSVDVDYADDSIIKVLSDADPHEVVKDEVLSGDYEDKCPYIFENTLVFTSNRPGGYGGFDLYYSKLEAGEWSAPVNFGPAINTSSDEYRPILFEEDVDEDRDMMVFSSNRPGGKGGFDLYFVGVME